MNSTTTLLIICAVIAVCSIPLILKPVPPNRLYGFRTRKTLSDPQIWFSANRFAGVALLLASGASALLAVWLGETMQGSPAYGAIVLVVPLAVAVVACVLYTRTLGGGQAG